MNEYNTLVQHYIRTAATGYGASETWSAGLTFRAALSRLSNQWAIKNGRDTRSIYFAVYFQKGLTPIREGDKLKIDNQYHSVIFSEYDSSGIGDTYVETRLL